MDNSYRETAFDKDKNTFYVLLLKEHYKSSVLPFSAALLRENREVLKNIRGTA